MTDVAAALAAHLHGMATPFLFVGGGLSRRYAGGDRWEGLLRRFAAQLPHPYEYYRASAGGNLPQVASRITVDFHEIWWSDPAFQTARDEWSGKLTGIESALKVEVAQQVASSRTNPAHGTIEYEELQILRTAVVDGVITTNYDSILEEVFPDYRVFVGQAGLLFSNPQGIAEIYKIHGSCSDPDSLILTAADYARFDERQAYLAAKLLTIFVEHPMVFLGYSMGDPNVSSILRSIAACLTAENVEQLRDRLIFVQWEPNRPTSFERSVMLLDGFQLSVVRLVVEDFRRGVSSSLRSQASLSSPTTSASQGASIRIGSLW